MSPRAWEYDLWHLGILRASRTKRSRLCGPRECNCFRPNDIGYGPNDIGYGPNDIGYGPSDLGYVPSDLGYVPTDIGYGPITEDAVVSEVCSHMFAAGNR